MYYQHKIIFSETHYMYVYMSIGYGILRHDIIEAFDTNNNPIEINTKNIRFVETGEKRVFKFINAKWQRQDI
jgi:hypothetical protein